MAAKGNLEAVCKFLLDREADPNSRTDTGVSNSYSNVYNIKLCGNGCITHSYIPLYTVYLQHIIIISHSGGMQEWVIQIPSIPILVSVLFPSLHLKYYLE